MDRHEQADDPTLKKFYKWLKDSKIEAPDNMLERVRADLLDSSSDFDRKLDDLFRQDTSLCDEQMIWKIRGRLAGTSSPASRIGKVSKWLAPIAAAATPALAVISFQSEGTKAPTIPAHDPGIANLDAVDVDEDTMKILALAANLEGTGDVTKLEAVENLSFLFE